MEVKGKKMKPLDVTLMGLGEIIGAGVFSMTGVAVAVAGPGIPITFLIAGLAAMLLCLPYMTISSAIPSKGGQYLYVSRFITPTLGFMLVWNMIFEVLNLSVLGLAAGQYLPTVLPFLTPRVAGVLSVLFVIIACLFNISTSAKVQNVMVVLVLAALGMFILLGIPNIKYFSFKDMIGVTGFTGIMVAVSYVRTAAYGAVGIVNMAGEIENPQKTVPTSMTIATLGASLLYAFVGLVAVGVVPWKEMINQPLSYAAKAYMPKAAFGFFVVGGALFAILTTIVGMTINYSRVIWAAADDGLFPAWLKSTNRFGVPYRIIILMGIAGIIPIALKVPLSYVFAVMNAPGMLIGLLGTLPALIAPNKLPERFKKAWFRIPKGLMWLIVITHISLTMFFSYNLFARLNLSTIIGIFIFYGAGVIYFFVRSNYLKKEKGIDLKTIMSTYDPSWISEDMPEKEEKGHGHKNSNVSI